MKTAETLTQEKSSLRLGGLVAEELSEKLNQRLEDRIQNSQDLNKNEIYYVSKINLDLINDELNVDPKTLEKLRQLCQLWDLQFQPHNLTSHRKFIGPIIVGVKKLLLPIIKILLKDIIQRQKLFNATAISLMAQLANQKK